MWYSPPSLSQFVTHQQRLYMRDIRRLRLSSVTWNAVNLLPGMKLLMLVDLMKWERACIKFLTSYVLREAWLMNFVRPFEQSMTEWHWEAEREQAHEQKRHSVRDSPNLSVHKQVVTCQTAKARGEIKLESYTLLANGVHLHLNMFDLPRSNARLRQMGWQ